MNAVLKTIVFLSFSILLSLAQAGRSFIIDTDVGTDDELALLYLLAQKDIDIKAITVVGYRRVSLSRWIKKCGWFAGLNASRKNSFSLWT